VPGVHHVEVICAGELDQLRVRVARCVVAALRERHDVVRVTVDEELRDPEGRERGGGRGRIAFRPGFERAEKLVDRTSPEAVVPGPLEVADARLGDGRDRTDAGPRARHPLGYAVASREPERQVPAGRVAAGRDPSDIHLLDVGEPVDRGRDVLERPGPAPTFLADAPVLDVPGCDPTAGEVGAERRHQRPVPPRPPEPPV
jgi:hypothetical protein